MKQLFPFRNINIKLTFPPLGQRIIKTAIAVYLCFLVYMLRGYQGMVSQAAVAAIICMQPYVSDSEEFALNRIIGTLVGAFWGLGFLWLMKYVPLLASNMIVVYTLMTLGLVLVFYCSVVFRISDTASLIAIVYLSIIINYPNVEAPIAQTLDRIIDTTIGVFISVFINIAHFPRKKHPERVFFVGLQDLVESRYTQISSRVLIELNRLYDEGAKICLESTWAPAFVLSQMGFVKITMPVIVMDGAAIYDIRENAFLEVQEIQKLDAYLLTKFLKKLDRGYCIFAIRENTMFTYLQGNLNWAEDEDFKLMRRSPYRNYIVGDFHEEDQLAVIRTLVLNEEADAFEAELQKSVVNARFRYERRPQPRFKDYTGFYFYHPKATIEAMEQNLLEAMDDEIGGKPVEAIHVVANHSNYIPEKDAPHLLRKIKGIYEPYLFWPDKQKR